jgi:hypothetical protein
VTDAPTCVVPGAAQRSGHFFLVGLAGIEHLRQQRLAAQGGSGRQRCASCLRRARPACL